MFIGGTENKKVILLQYNLFSFQMKNCTLKSDHKTKAWFEEEIKKIDRQILDLKIARPALRALVNASVFTVETLRSTSIHELKAMHGMGPSAIKKLETLYR